MVLKTDSKITPIIGLQWGDEGKGKGVARIASNLSKSDLIARFQGGNNAGHTIWHENKCYVFKLIPSGVFGEAQIHLGAGMVIDPFAFKKETTTIPSDIPFLKRISVSPHATLVIPTHLLLDSIGELKKGTGKIGSTGRGIGPAYTDTVGRSALRVGDIFQNDFQKRYKILTEQHKKILTNIYKYKIDEREFKEKEKNFFLGIKFLKSLAIVNSEKIVSETLNKNHKVIAEGAQGTLLDVRFGNYPFVTSSNTVSAAVCTGLGVGPLTIGNVFGIVKAAYYFIGRSMLFGSNTAFKKEAWEGYDINVNQGGDEVLLLRQLRKKGRILFLPNNSVILFGLSIKFLRLKS